MNDFIECESCASKPGAPTLCPSCVQNRATIEHLQEEVERLTSFLEIVEYASMYNPPTSGLGAIYAHNLAVAALKGEPKREWTKP